MTNSSTSRPPHRLDGWQTAAPSQLDDRDDDTAPHLRAMRAACPEFVQVTDDLRQRGGGLHPWETRTPGWMFNDALGELRAIFVIPLAQLSAKFSIDVEDDLASILPPPISDDDGDEDCPYRHRRWHRG